VETDRYLLRRLKRDVDVNLPTKTEQVLFCRLAPAQRATYAAYLRSKEVADVLDGDMQPFRAVGILRKICNHPDLPELRSVSRPKDFGHWSRSGKMLVRPTSARTCPFPIVCPHVQVMCSELASQVMAEVLKMWYAQGHRVLLFAQGRYAWLCAGSLAVVPVTCA